MKTIVASFFLLFAGTMAAEKPANCFKQESQQDPVFFTLIVLPDTQGYADVRHKETQKHWPSIGDQRSCFFKQTEWIKENKQKRNIVMAVHVGDITQTEHDEEWKIADTAFKTIDDQVPYILCSGNHDMGYSSKHRETSHSRISRFGSWFPPSRFTNNPLYDPHFGKKNSLHFYGSSPESVDRKCLIFVGRPGGAGLVGTCFQDTSRRRIDWERSILADNVE